MTTTDARENCRTCRWWLVDDLEDDPVEGACQRILTREHEPGAGEALLLHQWERAPIPRRATGCAVYLMTGPEFGCRLFEAAP
jgi:hypothetical protein